MKTKIVGILTCMLLIATVLPVAEAMDDRLDQKRNDAALDPDLVYYPTSHDFGNVGEGEIHHTIFEIWNGGTDTLTWNLGSFTLGYLQIRHQVHQLESMIQLQ